MGPGAGRTVRGLPGTPAALAGRLRAMAGAGKRNCAVRERATRGLSRNDSATAALNQAESGSDHRGEGGGVAENGWSRRGKAMVCGRPCLVLRARFSYARCAPDSDPIATRRPQRGTTRTNPPPERSIGFDPSPPAARFPTQTSRRCGPAILRRHSPVTSPSAFSASIGRRILRRGRSPPAGALRARAPAVRQSSP